MFRAICLVFMLGPAGALAQADVVHRTQLQPGDRWVYHRMDYASKKVTGQRRLEVARADERAIQVLLGKDGERDETYTAEWNAVATAGAVFHPHTGLLKFPLRVGDTWPVVYESEFGPTRSWRARHEHTARVVGWEDVEVPAGKFRALKIETEGEFRRLDTTRSGTARYRIWYVPEVKRWVKYVYEDDVVLGGPRGPNNRNGEELASFALR